MKNLLFVFLLSSFFSCKKPKTYCGAEDPTTEIAWIREKINQHGDKITIYEVAYNGNEGFYFVVQVAENVTSSYFNTCNNINVYQANHGGVVGHNSNFPSDFFSDDRPMSKIYPN